VRFPVAAAMAIAIALPVHGPASSGAEVPGGNATLPVVEIREDVHVRERTVWRNADYRIHGNIVLHQGGELLVENATVSAMCTYTREFRYQWEGGTLVTRNVTIGGAQQGNVIYQTYFELQHGTWEAEDTTIRFSSGVTMGWTGHPVKFHATRLRAGPEPDSIIMSSASADVVLRDCEFNISLAASASGGRGRLDLPVKEPVNRVFDGSNVPGVKYRLELINTRVPLWFVFFNVFPRQGPPTEVVLGHCPRLIPSIIAHNLQGEITLPSPWPAQPDAVSELTVGNLTLKTAGQPVHTWCWGLYLSGDLTDAGITGQTSICELFLSEGRLRVEGDAHTYNSLNSCTTVEVGQRHVMGLSQQESNATPGPEKRAELVLRNAALGRFAPGDAIVGQITAHSNGHVHIDRARCANLKLMTNHNGTIAMTDIERLGTLEPIAKGGAISIEQRAEGILPENQP